MIFERILDMTVKAGSPSDIPTVEIRVTDTGDEVIVAWESSDGDTHDEVFSDIPTALLCAAIVVRCAADDWERAFTTASREEFVAHAERFIESVSGT